MSEYGLLLRLLDRRRLRADMGAYSALKGDGANDAMSQDEQGGASCSFEIIGTNNISMDAIGAFKKDGAYYTFKNVGSYGADMGTGGALNGEGAYCTEIDICCTLKIIGAYATMSEHGCLLRLQDRQRLRHGHGRQRLWCHVGR